MASRVKQKEAEIWGKERVRQYAEGHKKWAGLMYGGMVKGVGKVKTSGRFLEMGAGPGFLAVMLAREYPDITVTAVDLSAEMAAVAKEYIAANKLEDRISYIVGDVSDGELMQRLGKFDMVYSTFSMHHWEAPGEAIKNLWNAVGDNGVLYIRDFRRMGFLSWLPVKDGLIDSIKAALRPQEIEAILEETGVTEYRIKTPFPFVLQSVIARK
jgi:2-polyprenyl-3-methyl-5-hydroxy-6-metoxy-1,4-benzoquinol methylase